MVERRDLKAWRYIAIGIVGDWAYRPLVETDGNGHILHSIVLNQIVRRVNPAAWPLPAEWEG